MKWMKKLRSKSSTFCIDNSPDKNFPNNAMFNSRINIFLLFFFNIIINIVILLSFEVFADLMGEKKLTYF